METRLSFFFACSRSKYDNMIINSIKKKLFEYINFLFGGKKKFQFSQFFLSLAEQNIFPNLSYNLCSIKKKGRKYFLKN